MRSVSSGELPGLQIEMIVSLGLPLNVASVILVCIFYMLLTDYSKRRLRSIPIASMTALTGVFPADSETNVHLLPVSLNTAAICCIEAHHIFCKYSQTLNTYFT